MSCHCGDPRATGVHMSIPLLTLHSPTQVSQYMSVHPTGSANFLTKMFKFLDQIPTNTNVQESSRSHCAPIAPPIQASAAPATSPPPPRPPAPTAAADRRNVASPAAARHDKAVRRRAARHHEPGAIGGEEGHLWHTKGEMHGNILIQWQNR